MRLRRFLLLALTGCLLLAAADAADGPFDYEALRYRARTLAGSPYVEKASRVPRSLLNLNYDQYRDIRFDPSHTLWRPERLPFQLQFFHPGGLFKKTVQIHEVAAGQSDLVEFSPRLFDYGANRVSGRIPADMGFAGFRILYDLNKPGDELAAFLGASYFRVLCGQAHYGLSARGLAIDTAESGSEEFPVFEEFWIERPAADAKQLVCYALLDSPSVAGAYQLRITPGTETIVHVRAALFFRKNPAVVGVAPLTSMFWHGENSPPVAGDFRPEVHDSDGLLLETGAGEWIWRPLANPKNLRVCSFFDYDPRGFGLMQRDRRFDHYDDLEAFYHLRPSAWVEPVGKWGAGSVRLVELTTPNEFNDNIVAFWKPEKLPQPGEPLMLEYRLHWMVDPGRRPKNGFVLSTKSADVADGSGYKRFVVEFDGPYLNQQPDDPAITPMVWVGEGAVLGHTTVQKNRFTGAWRVVFEFKPDGTRDVELRCYLQKQGHALTETWSYLWSP